MALEPSILQAEQPQLSQHFHTQVLHVLCVLRTSELDTALQAEVYLDAAFS